MHEGRHVVSGAPPFSVEVALLVWMIAKVYKQGGNFLALRRLPLLETLQAFVGCHGRYGMPFSAVFVLSCDCTLGYHNGKGTSEYPHLCVLCASSGNGFSNQGVAVQCLIILGLPGCSGWQVNFIVPPDKHGQLSQEARMQVVYILCWQRWTPYFRMWFKGHAPNKLICHVTRMTVLTVLNAGCESKVKA